MGILRTSIKKTPIIKKGILYHLTRNKYNQQLFFAKQKFNIAAKSTYFAVQFMIISTQVFPVVDVSFSGHCRSPETSIFSYNLNSQSSVFFSRFENFFSMRYASVLVLINQKQIRVSCFIRIQCTLKT